MSQPKVTKRDILLASRVINDQDLETVKSVLVRHVIRLVGVAFKEYNPNPEEWTKFKYVLKRIL